MLWPILALPAFVAWFGLLLLPWRSYSTRERLAAMPDSNADLSDITVLIPARNEAEHIGATLAAVRRQRHGLRMLVVDDR